LARARVSSSLDDRERASLRNRAIGLGTAAASGEALAGMAVAASCALAAIGANATEAKHRVRSKEFMRYGTGIISGYVLTAAPASACAKLKPRFPPGRIYAFRPALQAFGEPAPR